MQLKRLLRVCKGGSYELSLSEAFMINENNRSLVYPILCKKMMDEELIKKQLRFIFQF